MSNNALHSQTDEVALRKQSVLYKNPEAERIAYDIWYSDILFKRAKKLQGTVQGTCVQAVQSFLETQEIKGMAKTNTVNSTEPEVGAVVITGESRWGHVGVVIAYTESTVIVYESNVPLNSYRAGIRIFKINDSRIMGYHTF
jgi:hypothetical protein